MPRNPNTRRGKATTVVPEEVARVAGLMSTFPAPWALAGGWAVDAWLGRLTRDHGDVDVAIFDQPALFQHLTGWQLIGHEESEDNEGADPWVGRPLVLPAHIHARPPELSGPLPERFADSGMRIVSVEDGFWLDICLCGRFGGDWVLNQDPLVALPLADCITQSGWAVPTVAAEVVLFFKATMYVGTKNHLRRRDHADFAALLPLLSGEQRAWLRESISRVYVGDHPWTGKISV